MNHPLIPNIDHLTIDELQSRITDLTKKLSIAHRSGNAQLTGQIRMALDTFNSKYQEKIQAVYRTKNKDDPDYSDRIDIS
jgi:hypothetical protein